MRSNTIEALVDALRELIRDEVRRQLSQHPVPSPDNPELDEARKFLLSLRKSRKK